MALEGAYDARVVGNGTVTFRNKAVMEGFEASNEHTYTYTIEGSGGAENYKVRIYKYAAGHMETGLGNAKFRLLDANKQPILYPNDYEDTNLRGQEITFTTVAEEGTNKGYVTVMLDSSVIGYALAKDTVYYLEEMRNQAALRRTISSTALRFRITLIMITKMVYTDIIMMIS